MAYFPKSQLASDIDGGVIVEFAVAMPVMLLFVYGIMITGLVSWTKIQLAQATYAAARCGALNQTTCPTTTTIQAFAVQQAVGIANVTNATFTVTTPANCGGATAQASVKVQASYTFTFPFPSISVTLNPTACYPKQY